MTKSIQGVISIAWPILIISVVILVSLRIAYLAINKKTFILHKELLMLSFIIYILCLFQVVTFQDDVTWSSNNFIPFKEIFRYQIGSRLFLKNVLGNMLLFMPFGFFATHYVNVKKPIVMIILTLVASVSIEFVQMSIGRVFDVDDIILNLIGGMLGYYIYSVLRKVTARLPNILKSDLVLNIISIIILLGVISLI